jgi:hypothetical protein
MATNDRAATAEDLAEIVRGSPQIQQEMRDDPVATMERLAKPLENDPWIYRIIVGVLGAAIIGSLLAATVLRIVDSNAQVPDLFVAVGTGAIGALAGLLAPRPG